VLLVGGMGGGAYQKAVNAGLQVVLVSGAIAAAVQKVLDGTATSDDLRVHQH
jgi:hypothetical protein